MPEFRTPDPAPDGPASPPERPTDPGAVTFTVVLPAFQSAAYITEAVESLLRQTHPPHEIIVCDDGSTDDLLTALAPFGDLVELKTQENRGVSAAANTAARGATGEFIVRLDPDDTYLPRKLEYLAELAVLRPDLDILTTDAFMESDGTVTGTYYADFCTEPFRFVVDDQRRGILRANFVYAQAAVRRTCFEAIGGFDESLRCAEDWDLWLRLILAGARVGLVDEPLSHYRRRAGSLSSDQQKLLRSQITVLHKVLARSDLSSDEWEVASSSLRINQGILLLAELEGSLLGRIPGIRARAWAVAAFPGLPVPTRVKAMAAALAPGLVAAILVRRAS
jgi:glycosyltransferase involved in cell wall biosynthesis